MNRHCHRIIYNPRRGQWMAVAEHTRRSGKQAGEGCSVSGSRHPLRLLGFSLWCAFGLALILPAQARIPHGGSARLQAGGNIGLHSRSEGIRLEHTQAHAGQALHLDSAADILLGAAADHTRAQSIVN